MTSIPAPPDMHISSEMEQNSPFCRRHLLAIVVFFVAMAFVAAPWSFEAKAHAAMHGLCAQTPGHTFYLAGRPLPFDGRMTGIYGGLLATFLILLAVNRLRAAGLPSIGAGVVLVLFLTAMAVDGFNSLLTDLGKWHPYTPSNELRLLTGWMAGIGIGTVMAMLVGMTLWRRPQTNVRVIPSWWWPVAFVAPILVIRLLLQADSATVYFLLSGVLMVSAVLAFSTLALCTSVMLRNRENEYERFSQVRPLAALSVLIAIGLILAIGGGRFWLEAATGVAAIS